MAPIRRQIIACALWISIPIWIVPWVAFRAYQWIYEDICGWDDYGEPSGIGVNGTRYGKPRGGC